MKRFDPKGASQYLQEKFGRKIYTVTTLAKLRCQGGGPRFRRVGGKIIYQDDALDAFAESKLSPEMSSTSEAA